MSTPTISTQRLTLLPTPFDAKRCNYYVDGSNIVIETIPQYLARVTATIRDTELVSILLPKEGYVSLGTYPIASFSTVLANFDNTFYAFIDGLADVNFVQVVYGKTYIDDGDRRLSTGAITVPTIVDNGDGTATFSEIDVNIYPLPDFKGNMETHTVAEETFSFTNGAEEYVSVRYNAGTPIFYKETVGTAMNHSNILPIFVIWRLGSVIHSLNFDSLGLGLANKAQSAMYHTTLYKLSSDGGLVISETTSPSPRTITVTGGMVYTGAIHQNVASFNSFTDQMTFAYHVGGVWTYTDNLVYNNLKYDDGINLLDISNNKYAVRWFYRSIGDAKQVFYVCGSVGTYSSIAEASLELPRTDLPLIIKHHCMLIGRSIIQYNATNGSTQSLIQSPYSFSSVINHDDTANKSLAQSGVTWGHIDDQAQTITGTKTFSSLRAGGAVNYTEFEVDGTIKFNGDATVWDDVYPLSVDTATGASAPSFTVYNGTLRAYEFVGAATLKDLHIGFQLPHSYKEGSSIIPHLHLYIPNDVSGGDIYFQMDYTWTNIDQTGAVTPLTLNGTITRSAGQGIANNAVLSFGTISGVGKTISSLLMCRIYRDPTVGQDTFGSSVWLKGADVHFEMDTIGSRTANAK